MSRLGLRLHADEEHWIPLSDLMTGLMFLFLVISLAYMVAADLKHSKPVDVLKGYAASRARLYGQLNAALGPDLPRWHAALDPETLSIRFGGNAGLFEPDSAELTPQFRRALDVFFPRYTAVLQQHRTEISNIRIEGFASDGNYPDDMTLSQQRARNVLEYALHFTSVRAQAPWLMAIASADGFSNSHPVRAKGGAIDVSASDRVEFHVIGNASAKIAEALRAVPVRSPGVKATPTPLPPPTIDAPLPAYPAWAAAFIGASVARAFPHTAVRCFGYLDTINAQYVGRPGGAQVSGWAFDLDAWRPVGRIMLVDAHGTIVGAADGGFPRPDVQRNIKWISSPNTGWRGSAASTQGPVTPWAVMKAPRTACRLNVAGPLAQENM